MIQYHGGPITPTSTAIRAWTGRHAMLSFAHRTQTSIAAEVAQSFALDNGAFSFWKSKIKPDWDGYITWIKLWRRHPGFDWCLIPDVIDGTEAQNDKLLGWWNGLGIPEGVPVWHLHESMQRLKRLCRKYPRVALGSSGQYSVVGNIRWWMRISDAMQIACDAEGYPHVKLHGLRMLNPTIFSCLPLASADSTNVARNVGIDVNWDRGKYAPATPETRALILRERIESHCAAIRWNYTMARGETANPELIG